MERYRVQVGGPRQKATGNPETYIRAEFGPEADASGRQPIRPWATVWTASALRTTGWDSFPKLGGASSSLPMERTWNGETLG